MDRLDLAVENSASTADQKTEGTENSTAEKKKFVSPEISVPVDVLEATTFFQFTQSGATN